MKAFYYWAALVYSLLAIYLVLALVPQTDLSPELLEFRKDWPQVIMSHFYYGTVTILIGGAVLVVWRKFFNEDKRIPNKLYYLSIGFLILIFGLVSIYL